MGGPDSALIARACGETIRKLRRTVGIAQERLALEAGVDRSYMGRLERGEHAPTLDTIYLILPVLGVTFPQFAIELDRMLWSLAHSTKRKGPAKNR